MIFGTDTARYQPLGTYDPGAFEIVNIEDPQFEQKTARNLADGRPTGYYVWIYPGTDVHAFTRWAIGKARAAGSNFGAWADYEQDGVTLDLLDRFFAACDEAGEKAGYYGNDWRFGHDRFLARPFWLAGYPDPNDGQWRDGWAPRASRSVQLWQFTSGGGLDRNVVTDPAWFAAWGGPTSSISSTSQEDDMPHVGLKARPGDPPNDFDAFLVDGGVITRTFAGPQGALGYLTVPQDAVQFLTDHPGAMSLAYNDLEWALIERRTHVSLGGTPDPAPATDPAKLQAVKDATSALAAAVAALG